MKTFIKNIKCLKETKFLNFYNINYVNKLGEDKSWTAVSRKKQSIYEEELKNNLVKPDAVLILAVNEDNKLVLVKQFRVPINKYIYEIPAGLIDRDENIIETSKRELKEETGLDLILDDNIKIIDNIYMSPGLTNESGTFVIGKCKGKVSHEFLEPDEDIEVELFSKNEIKELIKKSKEESNGIYFDIKTYLAMSLFLNEF